MLIAAEITKEGFERSASSCWFYPGETAGHAFIYPKRLENQLAQDTKHVFVGNKGASTIDTMSGD
jgi:hypothetical protein